MALFVQIDHFRKTDQKPTVKNHLFSISWFRSFNRTSFQQQLKHQNVSSKSRIIGFNRTSFQQQLKPLFNATADLIELQSYILSTTTETELYDIRFNAETGFNRTSFQQQLKLRRCSYGYWYFFRFNRTSFQQQLKLSTI